MDINEIFQVFQFIANKYQDGYVAPDEFNRLFNWAQREYFFTVVEAIQGWDANKKRIKLPMGNAQQAIQKVAPFIVPQAVVPIASNGQCPKPATLVNMLAMRTSDDLKRIWRVESDRLPAHLSSVIDPPSESPVYVEYSTYYQIYPKTIGEIHMDYLQQPNEVNWAYTIVSGRAVYDPANSVQPLWDDTLYPEIVSRMLRETGISLKDAEMVGYFNSINQNGQ